MISNILPPSVVAVEAFADPPEAVLFAEEEAVISRSVEKRRREFTTVRVCARAALATLGLPPGPILPGVRGAPRWPVGIVGSMTHCAGYRAAAVAWARDVIAIGLDAEPHGPIPAEVRDAVALPAELAQGRQLAATAPQVHWDRLLFSAKESVFKAWYPLTGRELGFGDVIVTFADGAADAGTFTARLLVPGARVSGSTLADFRGRWLVEADLVATAVTVTPEVTASTES
jgi:4'-phosphopantetheinyl transferase EntD